MLLIITWSHRKSRRRWPCWCGPWAAFCSRSSGVACPRRRRPLCQTLRPPPPSAWPPPSTRAPAAPASAWSSPGRPFCSSQRQFSLRNNNGKETNWICHCDGYCLWKCLCCLHNSAQKKLLLSERPRPVPVCKNVSWLSTTILHASVLEDWLHGRISKDSSGPELPCFKDMTSYKEGNTVETEKKRISCARGFRTITLAREAVQVSAGLVSPRINVTVPLGRWLSLRGGWEIGLWPSRAAGKLSKWFIFLETDTSEISFIQLLVQLI